MEFLSLEPLVWLLALVALGYALRYTLVDQPAARRALSLLLRGLAIVALVVGLCRPYWLTPSERLHVAFLVDVSDSIDLNGVEAASGQISAAIDGLNPSDTWSLHAVAQEQRPLATVEELSELVEKWRGDLSADRFRGASRLGEGMLSARLAFPAGCARRLVVFSDGRPTDARLAEAVDQLAEERTDVRFAPIPSLRDAEAAVVSLESPSPVAFQGEIVRLRAKVRANRAMKASVRVLHRGVVVRSRDVELPADETELVEFDVEAPSPGPSRYTAEIVPAEDRFPLNNQAGCTINVRGEPRVLALHSEPRDLRPLRRALAEQGIEVDVRGKLGLPNSLEEVLAFDAVILADLPATDLTPRQMQMLKRYVIDYGGGLVMLGSENSFGLGGYFKTPVEEVLPLISRFEKEKEKPSLAMVLVIDKSGSMQGLPMSLARQAAKAAVELLSARDLIGVIGFDGAPRLVCDLRSAGDVDAVQSSIDTLEAGGGTYVYPAMVQARDMLETAPAKVRHMIVLSDGHTQPADHHSLAQEAADAGITVSTVALGGADRQLLSSIAELGRGRYYETDDPANVPQIFTKETMQASKSAIKEDLYAAVQTGDHPVLAGFAEADLPFSLGYVMTEVKPTAQLLLAAETGDPLLAVGRYGLGTGLCYTSDLTDRWGGEWLAWDGCGKFWSQVLRGALRKRDADGVVLRPEVVGETWSVEIDRFDPDGSPVNGVAWQAAVADENDRKSDVEVRETGLGRYRLEASTQGAERLSLRLHDTDADKLRVLHWRRPYPAEYSLSGDVAEPLSQATEFTPETIREGVEPEPSRQPVAHYAYLTSIGLMLAGLLLRRL
ncbi:von Willebrand factor type A domain protein [Planctomycetes bacterium MalM25]|nr:von Willebrand factor type A domain protein [Planctomycetes bacterium MalM25]